MGQREQWIHLPSYQNMQGLAGGLKSNWGPLKRSTIWILGSGGAVEGVSGLAFLQALRGILTYMPA